MKRFASLFAAAGAVAAISAFALAGGASGASSSLSTLTITETGSTGISLSSSDLPAGAVNIVATHSGSGHGSFGLVELNNGVTPAQVVAAVQSHHGDLNAVTALGTLFVSADAPGAVQANLTPGDNYYALNDTGNGKPTFAPFKVHNNPNAAPLPAPAATQTAIEFGFKGPKVLHKGTVVREQNGGFLVHMIDLIGAKNKAAAKKLVGLLRKGAPRKKARPYINGVFVDLLNPASPGALQQSVLNAKRGYYVEACFMDTEDGREHVRLGMERIVRVK